jgi:hypothetical protein
MKNKQGKSTKEDGARKRALADREGKYVKSFSLFYIIHSCLPRLDEATCDNADGITNDQSFFIFILILPFLFLLCASGHFLVE